MCYFRSTADAIYINCSRRGVGVGTKANGIYAGRQKDTLAANSLTERLNTLTAIEHHRIKLVEHAQEVIIGGHLGHPQLIEEADRLLAVSPPVAHRTDSQQVSGISANRQKQIVPPVDRCPLNSGVRSSDV